MAWSTDGEGSIGSPSTHIRSFQLSESSLSARRIKDSPSARSSADRRASTVVIARALSSSFASALRSPPDRGVGWCFCANRIHFLDVERRRAAGLLERRPAAVLFVSTGPHLAGIVEQPLA